MSTQTTQANGTREMYLRPTAFEVASETKPNVTYDVTLPNCTCPDFKYRRTHKPGTYCKHLVAALASAGWQVPGGNTRLDETTAAELLYDLGITVTAAEAALRRARGSRQEATVTGLRGDIAVITLDRAAGLYDIEIHSR